MTILYNNIMNKSKEDSRNNNGILPKKHKVRPLLSNTSEEKRPSLPKKSKKNIVPTKPVFVPKTNNHNSPSSPSKSLDINDPFLEIYGIKITRKIFYGILVIVALIVLYLLWTKWSKEDKKNEEDKQKQEQSNLNQNMQPQNMQPQNMQSRTDINNSVSFNPHYVVQ